MTMGEWWDATWSDAGKRWDLFWEADGVIEGLKAIENFNNTDSQQSALLNQQYENLAKAEGYENAAAWERDNTLYGQVEQIKDKAKSTIFFVILGALAFLWFFNPTFKKGIKDFLRIFK